MLQTQCHLRLLILFFLYGAGKILVSGLEMVCLCHSGGPVAELAKRVEGGRVLRCWCRGRGLDPGPVFPRQRLSSVFSKPSEASADALPREPGGTETAPS